MAETKPANMTKRDYQLLLDSYDELECIFQFCDGPRLRVKEMITCRCCHLKAKIAKRLGFYIPVKERDWDGDDWSKAQWDRRRLQACETLGIMP